MSWFFKLLGNNGVAMEVDGSTFRAQRVTSRPIDYDTQGAYGYGGSTGILPAALAANSEVFQFRWAHASKLAIPLEVRISASVTTTMFAAGVPLEIDMVKATAWSAQGTGGPTIAPAALLKKRASMASSLVASGDIRIAATAALGAGTKTLETLSMASIVAAGPITGSLNGTIIQPGTVLWRAEVGDGKHPHVFVQNEGFVIRSVAVPATGTWRLAVIVDWAEATAY